MTRKPVTSSAVKSIGYEDGVLEVEYANGGVYRMTGISKDQHDAIHAKGASIGRHINTLKGCCKSYTKCDPEEHGRVGCEQ